MSNRDPYSLGGWISARLKEILPSRELIENQQGFTLIEILVSLAIMAVLFGIVSLALVGVGSGAEATVDSAELGNVQRAIDIHMSRNGLDSIAPRDIPDIIDEGDTAWGDNHLRSMPSKCTYTWSSDGEVNQVQCAGHNCTTSYASLVLVFLGWLARKRKKLSIFPGIYDASNSTFD